MWEINGPLWNWLNLIKHARDARAEAERRTYRDYGDYSDQQWWEGYASGLEEAAFLLGIRVRRKRD